MVGRVKRSNVLDIEFVMVKEPGKSKSLQQLLADGRSTGHFKLQGRRLQAVRILYIWNLDVLSSPLQFPGKSLNLSQGNNTSRWYPAPCEYADARNLGGIGF